jgi:hypothetical protein
VAEKSKVRVCGHLCAGTEVSRAGMFVLCVLHGKNTEARIMRTKGACKEIRKVKDVKRGN